MKKTGLTILIIALALPMFFSCSQKDPNLAYVSHILIMYQGSARAPETVTRTKEEALAFTTDLLNQIKEGADFAELAKQHSNCPSSQRGGQLTPFEHGKMAKPFEDAAFTLKKGEVSGIVETEFGFHIIKAFK